MEKINFKNLPDKSTPINATNLNKLQDNVETAINDTYGTVLWTNSNPTGEFGNQNITLNSDDYDYYEIFYKISTFYFTCYTTTGKIPKGFNTTLYGNLFITEENRIITTARNIKFNSNINIEISDAHFWKSDYEGADNKFCVPIKIIGYKI